MTPRTVLSTGMVLVCFATLSLMGCHAAESPLAKQLQVEQIARIMWKYGSYQRDVLCTFIDRRMADQAGYQELEQQFLPGQWIVRYATASSDQKGDRQKDFELRQHDYLARVGLLEKTESAIEIGMIRGQLANEYRVTSKGWALDVFRGEKSNSPCFYYGRPEILRIVNYTESEKDADGYRTLQINFVHGVSEFADWANSDEAVLLFRSIKQSKEGQEGSMTLYQTSEGKIEIARRSGKFIEDIASQVATTPEELDENAVMAALENARANPGPSTSQSLPPPCFLFDQTTLPFKRAENSETSGMSFEAAPVTGSALQLQIRSYGRLVQLSKAGLLTLKEIPRKADDKITPRRFHIHLHAAIRDLLSRHGGCLPLGDVRIDLVGLAPVAGYQGQVRFKAKYVVTNPAKWISVVKDKELLPDLSALLTHGYPFEGTVYKSPQGWRAAYMSGHPPRYALPKLTSIGIATTWFSEAGRREAVFTSVTDHDVHIIRGRRPLPPAQSMARPRSDVHTINIYVNPSSRPSVFVLNAYDAMHWKFTLAPGARIGSILALGYEEQNVSGVPPPTAVIAVKRDFKSIDGSLTQMGIAEELPWRQRLGVTPTSVAETNGAKPVIIYRQ